MMDNKHESAVSVVSASIQPRQRGYLICFLDQQEVRGTLGGVISILGTGLIWALCKGGDNHGNTSIIWRGVVLAAIFTGPVMVAFGFAMGLSERLYKTNKGLSIFLYLLLPLFLLFLILIIMNGTMHWDWNGAVFFLALGVPFAVVRAFETIKGKILNSVVAAFLIGLMYFAIVKLFTFILAVLLEASIRQDEIPWPLINSTLLFSVALSQRILGGIKSEK